jgi:dTDP-4-dehydrorhamnose 3,5-epimerase
LIACYQDGEALNITLTAIEGMLILEPKVFGDPRGFFMESYNARAFNEALGFEVHFVQDNHSRSARGVLRGLHYQLPPYAQGKLVRVTQGEVFDVAVDMRRSSPSFGRWVGVSLSGSNHRTVWLPPGLAHGFLVTGEGADFLYKTTDYYAPQAERCVRWNDPALGIDWPVLHKAPLLTARDATAPMFAESPHFD